MPMRYLVTGASGLLGQFLVPFLGGRGYEVIAVTNTHDMTYATEKVHSVKCDLTQKSAIEHLFNQTSPDIVVHAAGMTSVDQCELNPGQARLMNTDVPSWIAEWTHMNARRYVFISSDHVTGGKKELFVETDPISPVNVYAQTKADAEMYVLDKAPSAQIIRTNFFGRGPLWRKSITDWLWDRAVAGDVIPAFSDSFFSPISAHYLSKTITDLSQLSASGIFHVGGSGRVSKYDFALQFLEFFKFDVGLVVPSLVKEARLAAPRPVDMSMSVKKVEETLGYRMPTLKQNFESIKNDYKR